MQIQADLIKETKVGFDQLSRCVQAVSAYRSYYFVVINQATMARGVQRGADDMEVHTKYLPVPIVPSILLSLPRPSSHHHWH